MLSKRVIPCLLLDGEGLVKTTRFKKPRYVGDPINAVRIFNEKEVDELIFLDIAATPTRRGPNFDLIEEVASECFMPLAYGGGIRTTSEMERLFACGVEKICLNTAAFESPELVSEAVSLFGSQSIIVSLDVGRTFTGKRQVRFRSGTAKHNESIEETARSLEALGVGELIAHSIDRDGTGGGYDLDTLRTISNAVGIPVVALGGAGSIEHFSEAVRHGGVSAVAAGKMFVFYGKHDAVLISYPSQQSLEQIFN